MRNRGSIAGIMLTAMLALANTATMAFDETKYPDWKGHGEDPPGLAINGIRASLCRNKKLR